MKYTVGKPQFKEAIFTILFWIVFLIYVICCKAYPGIHIFGIIAICICIFVVLPGMSYCELIWQVDEDVLQYTYHDTMFIKIKSFYKHILKNHKLEYQITLNMNQIDYIAVTYAKIPRFPYGAFGYDILFEVHMNDGSLYRFISLPISDKNNFLQAVEFMQKKGICFVDRYHILTHLHQAQPIAYYLEKMEKENYHD